MLKKEIQYEDLDGNSVKETFYFHLNKGELADMELRVVGGLRAHLQEVVDNVKTNPGAMIDAMKNLIKRSYGVRSADGKKFYKTDEIYRDFEATDAYSEFFYALCTDAAAASEFVNGVLGSTVEKLNREIEARGGVKTLDLPKDNVTALPAEFQVKTDHTPTQVRRMTPDELKAAYAAKLTKQDDRPVWLREGRKPSIEEFNDTPADILDKHHGEIMLLILPSEDEIK